MWSQRSERFSFEPFVACRAGRDEIEGVGSAGARSMCAIEQAHRKMSRRQREMDVFGARIRSVVSWAVVHVFLCHQLGIQELPFHDTSRLP